MDKWTIAYLIVTLINVFCLISRLILFERIGGVFSGLEDGSIDFCSLNKNLSFRSGELSTMGFIRIRPASANALELIIRKASAKSKKEKCKGRPWIASTYCDHRSSLHHHLFIFPLRSPTKPHRQRLPGSIQPFPLAGDFEKGVPLHRAAHHIAAQGEL